MKNVPKANKATLVFSHADEGFIFQVFHTENGWLIHSPDMELEHGKIDAERLELILASYALNLLSVWLETPLATEEHNHDALRLWKNEMRNAIFSWELLATLPGTHPGFVNLVHSLKTEPEEI